MVHGVAVGTGRGVLRGVGGGVGATVGIGVATGVGVLATGVGVAVAAAARGVDTVAAAVPPQAATPSVAKVKSESRRACMSGDSHEPLDAPRGRSRHPAIRCYI